MSKPIPLPSVPLSSLAGAKKMADRKNTTRSLQLPTRRNEVEPEEANLDYLLEVRGLYRGTWGEGAELLYRALIRALELEQYEEALMRLAKPKPGRKQERELAQRIWRLKAEKNSVPEIQRILESEGKYKSREAIAAYLKTRRKKKAKF